MPHWDEKKKEEKSGIVHYNNPSPWLIIILQPQRTKNTKEHAVSLVMRYVLTMNSSKSAEQGNDGDIPRTNK